MSYEVKSIAAPKSLPQGSRGRLLCRVPLIHQNPLNRQSETSIWTHAAETVRKQTSRDPLRLRASLASAVAQCSRCGQMLRDDNLLCGPGRIA